MIELYLGAGLLISILNLPTVFARDFDEWGQQNYGFTIPLWAKVSYVLLLVPLWPIFVFSLFRKF